jgi:predicted DNA-binding transcriptional regulator
MSALTLQHLEQLLELRSKTRSYHLLSATRQRLMNDLVDKNLVQYVEDETNPRDILQITERGLLLLTHVQDSMQDWMTAV